MAERSVKGILTNNTPYTLTLVSVDVTDGELVSEPSQMISPNTQGTWATQNSSPLTGTAGTLTYGGTDNNGNDFAVTCNWMNPFIGDDEFSISTTLIGGQAKYSSGNCDNAVVNYYLAS